MLLAIDTSTGTSVAVVDRDRGLLVERTAHDTMKHAEVIGSLLRDVLEEAGVKPADLDGVACGMGPGPFTGLRIGIAAARVFALAVAKPLFPVVSHDAVAFHEYASRPADEALLVVTDARRREVYWSAYAGCADGIPTRSAGPALSSPADLTEVRERFRETRIDAASVSAAALGRFAEGVLASAGSFASDEALYLRSPDVTLAHTAKRVTA